MGQLTVACELAEEGQVIPARPVTDLLAVGKTVPNHVVISVGLNVSNGVDLQRGCLVSSRNSEIEGPSDIVTLLLFPQHRNLYKIVIPAQSLNARRSHTRTMTHPSIGVDHYSSNFHTRFLFGSKLTVFRDFSNDHMKSQQVE